MTGPPWTKRSLSFERTRLRPTRPASAIHVPEGDFGIKWVADAVLSEKPLVRDIAIASIMSMLFTLTPPLLVMVIIDRVIVNRSAATVFVLLCLFLTVVTLEMMTVYTRGRIIEQLSARVDAKLNLFVMDRLLALPISYYDNEPVGITIGKIDKLHRIRQFFGNSLFATAVDATTLIVVVPAIILINPILSILVLSSVLGIIGTICIYRPRLWSHLSKVSKAQYDRAQYLSETVYGMRIIKFLSMEEERKRGWDAKSATAILENYLRGITAARSRIALLPFERLIYGGSIILGGALVVLYSGSSAPGALIGFAMLAGRAAQPVMQIANLLPEFGEVRHAIEELSSVVNLEPETSASAQRLKRSIEGRITFEKVRFRYPNSGRDALFDLGFDIPPGSYVGVVGRSGSGKTTISRLIQGANITSAGTVSIDGVNIQDLDLPHLRSQIGFVAQDDMIFKGTVRENILHGRRGASRDEVEAAARMAAAHEFIAELPGGYDSPAMERGLNFSGGQRQRIAIARALISDPKILILDEATSALDSESEAIINRSLKELSKDRTIIAISHRLSMLRHCDWIMVLQEGRLVDVGDHSSLVDRCSSYREMWLLHEQSVS